MHDDEFQGILTLLLTKMIGRNSSGTCDPSLGVKTIGPCEITGWVPGHHHSVVKGAEEPEIGKTVS
jgi:hypothetical protein